MFKSYLLRSCAALIFLTWVAGAALVIAMPMPPCKPMTAYRVLDTLSDIALTMLICFMAGRESKEQP